MLPEALCVMERTGIEPVTSGLQSRVEWEDGRRRPKTGTGRDPRGDDERRGYLSSFAYTRASRLSDCAPQRVGAAIGQFSTRPCSRR